MTSEMTAEEFCARFVAHMVKLAGETDPDGESIADYAKAVAMSYWEEPEQRAEGPEECAEADIDCWD